MNSETPVVDSIGDLAPQLANNRAYWLGWGSTDGFDADLPIYRSGLRHPLLNGVLRVRGIDIDVAVRRALAGTRWTWWNHPLDSDPGVAGAAVRFGQLRCVVGEQIDLAHQGQVDPAAPGRAGRGDRPRRVQAGEQQVEAVLDLPAGTLIEPDEIARAVLLLSSPTMPSAIGSNWLVDAGATKSV